LADQGPQRQERVARQRQTAVEWRVRPEEAMAGEVQCRGFPQRTAHLFIELVDGDDCAATAKRRCSDRCLLSGEPQGGTQPGIGVSPSRSAVTPGTR
jgi:hypothetical protein